MLKNGIAQDLFIILVLTFRFLLVVRVPDKFFMHSVKKYIEMFHSNISKLLM